MTEIYEISIQSELQSKNEKWMTLSSMELILGLKVLLKTSKNLQKSKKWEEQNVYIFLKIINPSLTHRIIIMNIMQHGAS